MNKKYYDLETIKETIWNHKLVDWEYGDVDPDSVMHALEFYTPTADVQPIVQGEWEKTEDFDDYGGGRHVEWTCSVCFCKAKGDWAVRDKHIDKPPPWNFCPNCGADMREES